MINQTDPQTQLELISHLPGDILLALARNDAVTKEMRKAAVKLMMDKGFKQYKHPELILIVAEINKEKDAHEEVESIVETALEAEIPSAPTMTAGFTTANMQQEEIHNPQKLGDDALAET